MNETCKLGFFEKKEVFYEEDIDELFLTSLLQSKKIIGIDNKIVQFEKTFHHCEGSLSFTASLKYLKQEKSNLSSVFVKLDKLRGGKHYKNLTRNEIEFYKLATEHGLNEFIPTYIESSYNEQFSYLIIEDLSECYFTSDYSSGIENFYMAAERLAEFHAYCLNNNMSKRYSIKHPRIFYDIDIATINSNHEKMSLLLANELDVELTAVLNDAFNFLKTHLSRINRKMDNSKNTLIHGDFHLKNCLFNKKNPLTNLKIIDWQWFNYGIGTYDIANMLNLYLPAELKFKEMDILKAYYNKLVYCGFRDYYWDECVNDYKIFTCLNLFKPDFYSIECRLRRTKSFWIELLHNISISYKNIVIN